MTDATPTDLARARCAAAVRACLPSRINEPRGPTGVGSAGGDDPNAGMVSWSGADECGCLPDLRAQGLHMSRCERLRDGT